MNLSRKLIIVLIIGLLIRLGLSAVTFHPDIVHFDLAGIRLGQGNLLNFYDDPDTIFNYPPAVYFTVGSLDWILTSWTNYDFHNKFLFNVKDALGDSRIYLHLFLLKISYLPFDLVVAYLLYNFFTDKKRKFLAFTFWIFNPLNLYSTYMMGQFDIIPTFFVVLALYVAIKKVDSFDKSIFLAVAFLGIGAAFKVYPLLFLLPLAFLLKSWIKKFLAIFLGISVYFITLLPFIGSAGFRSQALVANQTLKSLYAQIPLSGGEGIFLFLAAVGFFYFIYLSKIGTTEDLAIRFFMLLLIFFSLTHYHPQWFLWLAPFLIIELTSNNFKHLLQIMIIFLSWLGAVSLFDLSLSFGLFAPLDPTLYNVSANLWQFLGLSVDLNLFRSLFQSLFVAVALYFVYYYFPGKQNSQGSVS